MYELCLHVARRQMENLCELKPRRLFTRNPESFARSLMAAETIILFSSLQLLKSKSILDMHVRQMHLETLFVRN